MENDKQGCLAGVEEKEGGWKEIFGCDVQPGVEGQVVDEGSEIRACTWEKSRSGGIGRGRGRKREREGGVT